MPSVPVAPDRARKHFRGRQRRRMLLLVSLPGIILGTVSVGGAYSAGLLSRKAEPACEPIVVAAPARDSFSVKIQNSNETAGEGATVAAALEKRGFIIKGVTNAPEDVYVKRSAIVYHGRKGLDQALLVAQQIPGARTWNDGRSGDNVELVIGYGFTGMSYVAPPPPPLPSEITLNIYNTTYRAGLAGEVAEQLGNRGFAVQEVGNDPRAAFLPDDVAVIRYGPEGEAAAAVLQQHLKDTRLAPDEREDASLDLVLGNHYADLVAAGDIPEPAARPAPAPDRVARPCS